MKRSVLAIALCACGKVADQTPPQDARVADAPIDAGPAREFSGHLDQTPPVTFGGGPKGFCTYTMTLQDLAVALEIQPSGAVISGRVENLNVEALAKPCDAGVIPPKIATYTLAGAKPEPGGTMLTFQAAADNEPTVILAGTLALAGQAASVTLGFQRTGTVDPVLDWSVVATVNLTAAP